MTANPLLLAGLRKKAADTASVRVRASVKGYFSRVQPNTGNGLKWTWVGWFKRSQLNRDQFLYYWRTGGASNLWVRFDPDDHIEMFEDISNTPQWLLMTKDQFRDPSSWFHLTIAYDSTQAKDVDRLKVFINGTQLTEFLPTTGGGAISAKLIYPAQNYSSGIQLANTTMFMGGSHIIGSWNLDGYISDLYYIDGQALDASNFVTKDAATGAVYPKKYEGAFGPNGFHIAFMDKTSDATFFADSSGNNNHFNGTNVSLVPGPDNDAVSDNPTNNYATLDPLAPGHGTITDGALKTTGTTDMPTLVPTSGRWYFEIDGVGKQWLPPAAFPSAAGVYNFGQLPFVGKAPAGFKTLCAANFKR